MYKTIDKLTIDHKQIAIEQHTDKINQLHKDIQRHKDKIVGTKIKFHKADRS